MFLLRSILFLSPLAIFAAGYWLFLQVAELNLNNEQSALIYSIQEPVGFLNPTLPQQGVTDEITKLVFEPTLIRDDDLKLRPNLFEAWAFQTVVIIRCSSEEAAGESEAKIYSGEYLSEEMEALEVMRDGSVLTVSLRGYENGIEEKLVERFEEENLGDYLLVELKLQHSIEESFETFLRGAVEKSQIRMMEYRDDSVANLFLKGDTDLFLRELELYYESNRSLNPLITVFGEQCHTSYREMSIDLRRDVRWHDGMPLTASDVIFSYEEATGSGSSLQMAESFWFVEKLRMIDDHRIKVTCRDVPTIMLESWEKLPILPSHLLARLTEESERRNFFFEPVGNGPYRVASRRRDGGIELEASPVYFRGVVPEGRVIYNEFSSLESKLLALRSRRLDSMVPDDRFIRWADRNPGYVREITCLPRLQHFVAWNLDRKPFQDLDVRNALARGADVREILFDSAHEFQRTCQGLFFPSSPYCDETMDLPPYDPVEAQRLLAEAGFESAEADVSILSFTLLVNESNPTHLVFATALAEQYSALGVEVRIEPLTWDEIVTKRLPNREFDAVLLSWELPLERDRYTTWHSSGIESGSNFFGLRNQVVDELVSDLRYEPDLLQVKRITADLQKEIMALQPCLFIAESGRKLMVREDALHVLREGVGGELVKQPVGVGKAGLERSRPWWVRKEQDTPDDDPEQTEEEVDS